MIFSHHMLEKRYPTSLGEEPCCDPWDWPCRLSMPLPVCGPAVSESPVGEGMTVGGAQFLCRPTTVPFAASLGLPEYKCMTESEAIGLANALGRAIKTTIHGQSGVFEAAPGEVTAAGVARTATPPEEARVTAIQRIYAGSSTVPSWVTPALITGGVVAAAVGIGFVIRKYLK